MTCWQLYNVQYSFSFTRCIVTVSPGHTVHVLLLYTQAQAQAQAQAQVQFQARYLGKFHFLLLLLLLLLPLLPLLLLLGPLNSAPTVASLSISRLHPIATKLTRREASIALLKEADGLRDWWTDGNQYLDDNWYHVFSKYNADRYLIQCNYIPRDEYLIHYHILLRTWRWLDNQFFFFLHLSQRGSSWIYCIWS